MEKMKIDAIDLIIAVLRDHEKMLDMLLKKLERLTEKTHTDSLYFNQAIKIIKVQAETIRRSTQEAAVRRIAIHDFVHTLNRWELIPDDWIFDLIAVGEDNLQELKARANSPARACESK